MLQPKQTKFRKMHKGRNRGLAQSGNSIAFGEYALKATTMVVAFKAYSPNAMELPDCARPLLRPLCIFLNFVCLGCNIINFLEPHP